MNTPTLFGGYRLQKFTETSFNKTRAAWEAQVASNQSGIFSSEYVMILDYYSKCLDYNGTAGNSYALASK
jgi:hypothetical protein